MTVDRSVTIRLRVSSAEFDAAMARAGASVRVLRAEVEGAGRGAAGGARGFDDLGNAAKKAGDQGAQSLRPLLTGALLLAPALIPVAGAALAMGAGFVGAGAAGLAAFKGIQTEMKNNTALGKQYSQQIGILKTDLAGIEQTAARSVAGGFDKASAKIQSAAPLLRVEIGQLATTTGDIVQHLVGGLANGLQTFEPLMQHVLNYADKAAARFESWSTGPGGAKFADALSHDFDMVVPVLADLIKLAGNLASAFSGPGNLALHQIDLMSQSINWLVTHVPGATSLLVGFFAAFKASQAITAAATALKGFAAAEGEAAVAGGARGLAGSLGVGISRLAPYAAGWIGAAVALGVASSAADKWAYSNNIVERVTARSTKALSDLAHLNVVGGVKEIFGLGGSEQQKYNKYVDDYNRYVDAMDKINTQAAAQATRAKALQSAFMGPVVAGTRAPVPAAAATPDLDAFNTAHAQAMAAGITAVTQSITNLNRQIPGLTVSAAAQSWSKLQAGIQSTVDPTDAFLKLGGQLMYTYKGVDVGQRAWDAALAKNNGNVAAATGQINGMIDAMQSNRDRINGLIVDQVRLAKFQGDTTTKYKLTTDQVDLYSKALGLNAAMITQSNSTEADAEKVIGLVADRFNNGNAAMQTWLTTIGQIDPSVNTLATRVSVLGAGLQALRGTTLDMATTNLSAADAAEKAAQAINDNKASIGANGQLLGQLVNTTHGYVVLQPRLTAGSLQISQAMSQTAQNAIGLAQAIYQNTGNIHLAIGSYDGLRAQFVHTQIQMGLTGKQAEGLATQIFGIPTDHTTLIKQLGKKDVAGAIADLTKQLAGFSKIIAIATLKTGGTANPELDALLAKIAGFQGTHTATLKTTVTPANIPFVGPVAPNSPVGQGLRRVNAANPVTPARGGHITGPGTGTSDSIPAMLSNGEFVMNANATKSLRPILETWNRAIPAFANGGFVGPSLLVPTKAATKKARAASKSASRTAATRAASAGRAAASKADAQARLLITISGVDVSRFLHSLSGTASQIQSAESTLANAVTKAGGGATLGALLAGENKTLLGLAGDRTNIANRLANANQKLKDARQLYTDERSTVAGGTTGAFDITQAGRNSFGYASVGGILGDITAQNAHAALFRQQIEKLQKLGLDKHLVEKLATGGYDNSEQSALALSGASKRQIAVLNAGVKRLGGTGNAIGTDVATQMYGAGVNMAQGLVNGLKSQENSITKQIIRLGHLMVTQLERRLRIHSPSLEGHDIGALFGTGVVGGVVSTHGAVATASTGLGHAMVNGARSYANARPVNGGGAGVVQLAPEDRRLLTAVAAAMGDVKVTGNLVARGRDLHSALSEVAAGRAG